MTKSSLLALLDNALVFILGIFLLLLPFIISTATTDVFTLPKQIFVIGVVLLSLVLWAAKMILSEKVTFRRTPFDLPVVIFLCALLLSSLFAVNRFDSLIATIPVILAGLSVFLFSNTVKKENTIVFVLSMLLVGAGGIALVAIFSYFKVYPLLFSFTHVQSFSPIGSLLEQAFYFAFVLPVAFSLAWPIVKGTTNNKTVLFGAVSILIAAGLVLTLLQLFTTQQPILLPFETGFQTAFAAISQDTGRIAQGFVFGSGYGNFSVVFTRFKQASFNANTLWATQFNNSSSLLLELLATTGVLGMLAYLFLLFLAVSLPGTKKKNPVYVGIVVLALCSIILPFSFFEITLLFILIGLFASVQGLEDRKQYYDVEVKFVGVKKGMISLQQITVPSHEKHEYNRPTAFVVAGILLVVVVLTSWQGWNYVLSNMVFQQSLVLASGSNGTATYKDQAQAITLFPYQSIYYRSFSQTNIALAGSLASIQRGSSPSGQTQNTLYALIQQGITTGKQATTLSPQSVADWQNLSSVYRALIGVGQNADSFAISASQQAVVLDPNNPQEYVALGGIYYQLGQWDNAIREFQQASLLKQDYANAYYNLGHAYEQKQDYQDALTAFQTVQQLVANDKNNLALVNSDIQALQAKMGQQGGSAGSPQATPTPTPKPVTPATVQSQPLQINGVSQPTPTSAVASPAPLQ